MLIAVIANTLIGICIGVIGYAILSSVYEKGLLSEFSVKETRYKGIINDLLDELEKAYNKIEKLEIKCQS